MLINSIISRNRRSSRVRRNSRRDNRRRFLMIELPVLLVGALATTYILKASAITAIDASYKIDLSSIDKNAIPNGAQVWVYFASDGCGVTDYGDRYDQERDEYYSYITDKTPINSTSSDEMTKSVKLAPGKYCVI